MHAMRNLAALGFGSGRWVIFGLLPALFGLTFVMPGQPAHTGEVSIDRTVDPTGLDMEQIDDPVESFEHAVRYYRGIGVQRNFKQALAWYLHAADLGFPVHEYRMSDWQFKPIAVPPAVDVTSIRPEAKVEAKAELRQVIDPLAQMDRDAMRRLQRILTRAGFDPGPADGILGPKTRAAFERFQEMETLNRGGADQAGL